MIQPRGLRLTSISKPDVALGWLTDCLCIPQLDRSSRRNKIPMTFEIHEILLIATAILLSSIVQGAVGFAVALIAIPLFLQAGLDLAQSIFVVLICGIVQNALGLRQTWHDTPIRKLTPWAIFRAALVPIGFLLMRFIENCSKSELRQMFGIILLGVIICQLALRIRPSKSVASYWTGLAMGTSGIAQGMIGTPGPPIAFWVMAHDWESKTSRGVMFFLFVTGSIPHLIIFLFVYELHVILSSSLIGVCGIPLSFVGAHIGLWIGNRFDRKRIRQAILATLLVLSFSLIVFK